MLQEWDDLAIEEFHDGPRHDFEGQGIARVGLDQPELLRRAACDPLFGQQLLACLGIQPGQAQGTHGSPAAFQRHEVARFLPTGQQQAALMLGLGNPAQHPDESLVAGTYVTAVLSFLQKRFQVVMHQQNTSAAQAF